MNQLEEIRKRISHITIHSIHTGSTFTHCSPQGVEIQFKEFPGTDSLAKTYLQKYLTDQEFQVGEHASQIGETAFHRICVCKPGQQVSTREVLDILLKFQDRRRGHSAILGRSAGP